MNAAATTENLLGVGLYTPREAAYYARVSPQLITRWFYTNPVLEPGVSIPDQRLITFADFIQLGAIRTARKEGVSLSKIRQALFSTPKSWGSTVRSPENTGKSGIS